MDAPPSSRVSQIRQNNANTRVSGMGTWEPALDLAVAYRSAVGVHRTLPPMQELGYRLFDVGPSGVKAWLDLPARREVFAVAGRHSCCDLRLDGDPEVALRHMLVRAQLAPGGEVPMLRLLDLYTTQGFRFNADAIPHESSALVVGPLAMYVGRNAFVALPGRAPELPVELPAVEIEPASRTPYRSPALAPAGAVPRWTHVSLLARAPSVHELRSTGGTGLQLKGEQRPAPSGLARFALERQGAGECVEVGVSELDTGILIGRASKCDRRFASLLDEKVSRVHLLVMQDAGETVAYDLASTNGTYVRGTRLRRSVLPDVGATLALGLSGVKLHWHPRA